jgi:succinate dehydrogenase/fumarate reductase flavoprotein subunit
VRPPIEPFMVLGGLMLGRDDIPHFVHPFASAASFRHVARILLRHAGDRLRYRRGARLVMGNALVARLLWSLRRTNVPLMLKCRLVELVCEEDRVTGAVIEADGARKRVRARRGVVLATGGFSHSAALRAKLIGRADANRSVAFTGNRGDGLAAARAAGAVFGDSQKPAFWMPVSVLREGGRETLFPHIVLDRAKPGLIAVNVTGRRFVNEACSYHDFVEAMLRAHADVPTIPAWLVCDRRFIADYGIGLVHPGSSSAALDRFIAAEYLRTGETVAALAGVIGVDAGTLEETVRQHNRFADKGVDEAFGKGGNALNRHNGDPRNRPNPCLRPIAEAPFFAVAVYPADLGTSVGLRTNTHAQVLRADGTPIGGLYACGNDMDSIMAGAYPGPGITLGPAMVFAYRAVQHMAGAAE